mgnify:CR=1 FL=1
MEGIVNIQRQLIGDKRQQATDIFNQQIADGVESPFGYDDTLAAATVNTKGLVLDSAIGEAAGEVTKEFFSGNLISKYELYYSLLYDSAIKEKNGFTFLNSTGDFQNAITELKSHADDRNIMAKNYLSN